ncbi:MULTISPECIES: hypothetical protein [unclassified Oleiphilus]|uniref:hypothetical protein n=1 Tax=unclassified Oleiphilus TaxID=2631174 RepID=UPI000ABF68E0|nr:MULTISPECIES: hypothetical protein [unclassified Oleiphilus]
MSHSSWTSTAQSVDSGLVCLVMLARFYQVAADMLHLLIEFFMSPLLRYQYKGLRER